MILQEDDFNAIIDVMASITIRNLDDSLKEALRQRAAANRRSMEEEARQILKAAITRARNEKGLGTLLQEIWKRAEGFELEVPPRTEMPRKPPFLTDEEWEKP